MKSKNIISMSLGGAALGGVVGYLLATPITEKSLKFKKKYDESIEELKSNRNKVRALEFKGGRTKFKEDEVKLISKELAKLKEYGIITPEEKTALANIEASLKLAKTANKMTNSKTKLGVIVLGATGLASGRLTSQIEVIKAKGLARAESAIKKLEKKRKALTKLNLKAKDHHKLDTLKRRSQEIKGYKDLSKKHRQRRNLIVGASTGLGLIGGGLAGVQADNKNPFKNSPFQRNVSN